MGFFDRYKLKHVGRVTIKTVIIHDVTREPTGDIHFGYADLFESDSGRRKARYSGDGGYSPLAKKKRAEVQSWVKGGPKPQTDQPAEPRRAKLFAIDGGRR